MSTRSSIDSSRQEIVERQQLPVSEIAKAMSGAVTSVLSKLTTGVAAVSDNSSSDEFERPSMPTRGSMTRASKPRKNLCSLVAISVFLGRGDLE